MFRHDNPPTRCRRGHELGPNRCTVSSSRCTCDRAAATGGHLKWRCNTCGDVQYADDHVDDSKLLGATPGPSPFPR